MAESTIAAISTALGSGGIAIIRVSGPDAVNIAQKILTRKVFDEPSKFFLTSLLDEDGKIIDRVLAVRFPKGKSYTGEEVVEIHTHGGIFLARKCLELATKNGARIAEPGEFTRRAFLNGRIDLAQAEGVLSLIQAKSIEALHAAARTLTGELSREARKIHDEILRVQGSLEIQLDFPEGETLKNFDAEPEISQIISHLENLLSRCNAGMLLRDGVRVVIAGSPNVGKSSLLNALLGKNRAIVTEIPGTTRDIINENFIIDGLPVIFSDTAGIRETENIIEAEGVKLAREAVKDCDVCLYVLDSSREISEEEKNFLRGLPENTLIILNKSDLPQIIKEIDAPYKKIHVSAKNLTGINEIRAAIFEISAKDFGSGLNVSARQLDDLRESFSLLKDARASLNLSEDITAGLLNDARILLLRVLGLDAGDELLDYMFGRFCVGK